MVVDPVYPKEKTPLLPPPTKYELAPEVLCSTTKIVKSEPFIKAESNG